MKKLLMSVLAVALISGCGKSDEKKQEEAKVENQQTVECPENNNASPRQVVIDPEQYLPFDGEGEGEIFGQFCVEDVKGDVKCLAEQMVVLNPVTDYSTEWFVRNWTKNEILTQPDEIAKKHNKITKTDENGNFSFKNLKPGTYYVGAVACPCVDKDKAEGEKPNFKLQRHGAKITVVTKSKADLRKVFEEPSN